MRPAPRTERARRTQEGRRDASQRCAEACGTPPSRQEALHQLLIASRCGILAVVPKRLGALRARDPGRGPARPWSPACRWPALPSWVCPVGCSSLSLALSPSLSRASQAGRLPGACRPCGAEANRARVGALLVRLPPPRVIFAPRGRPPMLVWLQTADHKRGASPVQEAEGAAAAGDRTGILRFPMGQQAAPIALRFVHHRRGIFSALPSVLHPRMPSLGWDDRPGRPRAHAASTVAAGGGCRLSRHTASRSK